MGKRFLIKKTSIISSFITILVLFVTLLPVSTNAYLNESSQESDIQILEKIEGLNKCPISMDEYGVAKKVKMMITAYSSTPDQTDDTPFITASGKWVEDGIIANNMLPFGTKVRIPELYGEKVFTVQDRMHRRKGKYHADIWFEKTQDARDFGAKVATIEILEG